MRSGRRALALLVVTAVAFSLMVPAAVAVKPLLPNEMGVRAYSYIVELTQYPRVAGTQGEIDAAHAIKGWFDEMGYSAELQPFTYVRGGVTYSSQNVVAFSPAQRPARKGPMAGPTPLVVVGAHYDKVSVGKGADDNASGVGVVLELAERVARYRLPYDIVFIAFGAEEVGLRGARAYVNAMSDADKARTLAMLNFDSLITGDKLYVHAGQANGITWVRDEMMKYAERHKLPLEMQPGLNPDYPAGLSPGFSDVAIFDQAGIPVAGFEATNWEIDDMDGYTQTEEFGSFWHTSNDDLAVINELIPDRPMVRLEAFTRVSYEFLKHLKP